MIDKVSDGPCVIFKITAGETLVGTIEEGEVLLFSHNLRNIFPLLPRRVDTGRVVGTGVEEDYAALWCVFDAG